MNNTDTVKQLVSESMQALILEALNKDNHAYINQLVKAALSQPVNSYGGEVKYHGDAKYTYLEYLVGDAIRGVARTAVLEALEDIKPQIMQGVKNQITVEKLLEKMSEAILASVSQDYKLEITFTDESKKSKY